jgi:hypothetical protein
MFLSPSSRKLDHNAPGICEDLCHEATRQLQQYNNDESRLPIQPFISAITKGKPGLGL